MGRVGDCASSARRSWDDRMLALLPKRLWLALTSSKGRKELEYDDVGVAGGGGDESAH